MAAGAEEKLIGRITHYFSHLSVCSIELTDGELKVGDTIHISGKHTDFTQTVASMQLEHQNINRAERGKVVGVKVTEKVRKDDHVFGVEDLLGDSINASFNCILASLTAFSPVILVPS